MRKLAILIAAGLGVTSFVLLSLYKQRLERDLSGGQPTPVLVAIRDVAIGEMLSEDMVAVRELPASYVEGRHVLAAEARKAIGVRVSMGLRANEAILWTDLAGSSFDRRDLSGLVQSGMRALTVSVGRGSTLNGLLRPGDRIDLLLTSSEGLGEVRTVPLLQNLLVLAVGHDMGGSVGNAAAQRSASSDLTLTVTAEQAQAIAQARTLGTLTVVLRNPEDIVVARDLPATTNKDLHEGIASLQKERGLEELLEVEDTKQPSREIEHVH